jgi:hypothetical protein
MSYPNTKETPRSFSPHPYIDSGSDHRRSQSIPESGTSYGLYTSLIYERSSMSGDSPPCIQRILSSIIADIGK